MSRLTTWMDRTLYPELRDHWDDEAFRRLVQKHVSPAKDVLDLGAGAGIVPQMNFRGLARSVCGVDPDPRVCDNPHLDEARIGMGERIPYPNRSFDVVLAGNVLEHLERPRVVFDEVKRVLRPGGFFLVKTPNRFHYVAITSALTPTAFHRWVNTRRGRHETDTFPTFYHANTRGVIQRIAGEAGFKSARFLMLEGRPEYLRFSGLTYLFGCVYERIVSSSSRMAAFRVVILAEIAL